MHLELLLLLLLYNLSITISLRSKPSVLHFLYSYLSLCLSPVAFFSCYSYLFPSLLLLPSLFYVTLISHVCLLFFLAGHRRYRFLSVSTCTYMFTFECPRDRSVKTSSFVLLNGRWTLHMPVEQFQ
jgi:hypothetical protein